jgi:RNA polymerase sigma-70 factor (ECF subfamily)
MLQLHEDRRWMEAFRAGERWALDRVYREHVMDIATMLRRGFSLEGSGPATRFRGYDRELDLESALQDVFLRAFSDRARLAYDGLRPYGAYLAAIARNVVIDELRRVSRNAARFANELPEVGCDAQAPAAVEGEELQRLVAEAVATLPASDREVYEQRFVKGLTQLEAARALGITRIQVRRRENRLKRSLLASLKAAGYGDSAAEVRPIGSRSRTREPA